MPRLGPGTSVSDGPAADGDRSRTPSGIARREDWAEHRAVGCTGGAGRPFAPPIEPDDSCSERLNNRLAGGEETMAWYCNQCGQQHDISACPTPQASPPLIHLLPCPFCGAAGRIAEYPRIMGGSSWAIVCENGDCFSRTGMEENRETALAHWNRRAG